MAAIISPWINLINKRLTKGDCALSMTDSTIAKGWMRKTNFTEQGDNNIQVKARVNTAWHHAGLFIDGNIKGYSQWFPGKANNVADALSQVWHRCEDELTKILCSHFPKQMPAHFEILPLPSMISSWLIFALQRLPANMLLREQHTTTGLELGGDGSNVANLLDATTSTWTASQDKSKFSCWAHLPWLSEQEDFWGEVQNSGWRHSQKCHFTCGTDLPKEGQTKSH